MVQVHGTIEKALELLKNAVLRCICVLCVCAGLCASVCVSGRPVVRISKGGP